MPKELLIRFIVTIVFQFNLQPQPEEYPEICINTHRPANLLFWLFYGRSTAVFSSRITAQAAYDAAAFLRMSTIVHSIAPYCKLFLGQLTSFSRSSIFSREMHLLHLNKVNSDGSKRQTNAFRHLASGRGISAQSLRSYYLIDGA